MISIYTISNIDVFVYIHFVKESSLALLFKLIVFVVLPEKLLELVNDMGKWWFYVHSCSPVYYFITIKYTPINKYD